MASIETRDLAGYERAFRVVWREAGRKRSATFYDLDDAKDFRHEVERNGNRVPAGWVPTEDLLAGAAGRAARHATPPAPLLLDVALAHSESKNTRAAAEHRMKMRRQFERHLEDLGELPIDTVRREHVQAWCDQLVADGYRYKTIKNLRSEVSTVFKFAVLDGLAPHNPVAGTTIDADPEDTRPPVFLEPYEFDAVAGFLSGEDLAFVETLVRTGLRKGEALALRVGDVRLRDATPSIRVTKAIKHGHNGVHRIGKPKTKSGLRTVPIDDELAAMLRTMTTGRAATDPLFPEHGNDGTWQRNVWVPALTASGLIDDRRPRIHDLRHTAASWLLAAGIQIFVVSKMLGHADIQTTANIYGHLDQGSAVEAAQRMGALRAEARRARIHVV